MISIFRGWCGTLAQDNFAGLGHSTGQISHSRVTTGTHPPVRRHRRLSVLVFVINHCGPDGRVAPISSTRETQFECTAAERRHFGHGEFLPHARAKKLPRAAECLVYSLTPSGVLAENHPKHRGFVGVLRGQKHQMPLHFIKQLPAQIMLFQHGGTACFTLSRARDGFLARWTASLR